MKQFTTIQDWAELSEKEMIKHQEAFAGLEQNRIHNVPKDGYKGKTIMWRIGEMIEFLGDDLGSIENQDSEWEVWHYSEKFNHCGKKSDKKLVDALWEAVKEKLND